MHHSQQKTLKHWHRTVLFFSVALLIAWNFAAILHQIDITPEHHTHHHCQLFSGVQHGLVKAQSVITPLTYTRVRYHDTAEGCLYIEAVPCSARAPPSFA
ncbi:uncharacterized protein DUF2607 [Vibrio sp. ES.051]|uniref:DUF2607 family protein n=1 Tax=Vibrio sp. ES.051 TaxID=1761909 RepID=UPI000BF3A5A2|nr:DUF2607 family protein [Vibrio sp. ES.051]PFG45369.1 uncharacterized protein DUF2607 [Vibrio sp. ES.051]